MPPTVRKAPATPEVKLRNARRVATQAINNAAVVAADESVNRSTRTRSAYKIKADALDQVARILAGKAV